MRLLIIMSLFAGIISCSSPPLSDTSIVATVNGEPMTVRDMENQSRFLKRYSTKAA